MSATRWKLFRFALVGSSLTLAAAVADEPAAKDAGPAAIFKQLDVNGDGELTKDEIPADKRTIAERLFRNADKNNDGKLTTEEFKAGLEKQAEPRTEGAPAARPFGGGERTPGQGAEQLWKMLDRNGTGSVKPSDVPEERRERFTKMLEAADSNKDGALSKEEFQKFTARMAPQGTPGRERTQGSARPEGSKDGERKPEARPDGERKPEARPDGARREAGPRDGDKPAETRRPEGRPEGRPEMRREGDRPAGDRPAGERPEGRPEGRPGNAPEGQRGPGAVGIFFLLDTDRDGKLSKSELENAAKVLSKLDKNGDGEITPQELSPGFRPDMRRAFEERTPGISGRPESRRPESDRPRESERRPEARGDGERRPAGPRDGDKPREGDRPRDGEKPKSE